MAISTAGTLPTDSESASLSADKDLTEETIVKELTEEQIVNKYWQPNAEGLLQYVKLNEKSTNTTLFSFLALLNMYVPESYLLPSQCQEVLGPPDPIYGGPPFEDRMQPFTVLIHTLTPETSQEDKRVQFIHPAIARRSVQLLHKLGFSRSDLVKSFMTRFSGDHTKPHPTQFIKDLLTKRELGDKRKNNFSKLIEEILNNENLHKSKSVLLIASEKFKTFPLFPQTLARLNYIKGYRYDHAERWATEAIRRAPKNSYVADTLGQVYKNSLLRNASDDTEVLVMANRAMKAFKAVCEKAEKEVGPEMEDTGVASVSNIFNNRGLFGCNQVAKIIFDKLTSGRNGEAWRNTLTGDATSYPSEPSSLQTHSGLISNLKSEVKDKYHFFEWYLTYSRVDSESLEPSYFWKDVVLCYQKYTNEPETQTTSFPAIFDCLYHGLYTSKGRRAGFEETAKTTSDLETMLNNLEHSHKASTTDVGHAERYILSNLILSNKVPDSPKLTPIKDLKMIICIFLAEDLRHRSPEFYLLALLLFWPEQQQLSLYHDEEDGKREEATKVEQNKTWEDDEPNGSDTKQQTLEDVVQLLSLDSVMNHDLNDHVSFMENSFQKKYAKYLRGRYLLPLFFLGKGGGLSRWVHKSRLDVILEAEAKIQEDSDKRTNNRNKRKTRQNRIDEMWNNRHVWKIPEVQDLLLPVQGEASSQTVVSAQNEVFACTEGKKIRVEMQDDPPTSAPNSTFFLYLGFTIQGPVAFNMGPPCK